MEDAGRVVFKRREDSKYLCNRSTLDSILSEVSQDYFILEINDIANLPYETTYFDNAENDFYLKHHNKNYSRFKIRRRYYPVSGDCFFEVKEKTNKRNTVKHRLKTEPGTTFSDEEYTFIRNFNSDLQSIYFPVLQANFFRITLVRTDFSERCTIDTGLTFLSNDKTESLDDLAIFEVKCEQHSHNNPMKKALKLFHVRSQGFSKYCIGRALTDETLKRNNFKETISFVNKQKSI